MSGQDYTTPQLHRRYVKQLKRREKFLRERRGADAEQGRSTPWQALVELDALEWLIPYAEMVIDVEAGVFNATREPAEK